MRIPSLRFLSKAGLVLALGLVLELAAQLEPDAPVQDFMLPRFDDEGYRKWDLSGRQGVFVSSDQVDVLGMRLRVFKDRQPDTLDLQIESPRASIMIRENRARGDTSLLVLGEAFSISGVGWSWDGESGTIAVRDEVRVAFTETFTDILK